MGIKTTTTFNGEVIEDDSLRAFEVTHELLVDALARIHEVTMIMPEILRADYDKALKGLRIARLDRRAALIVDDYHRLLKHLPPDEAFTGALEEDRFRKEHGVV